MTHTWPNDASVVNFLLQSLKVSLVIRKSGSKFLDLKNLDFQWLLHAILQKTYHIHSIIIMCSVFHHYYCMQPLLLHTVISFLLFLNLVSEQTWYFSSSWTLQAPKIWTLIWLHRVSLLLQQSFPLVVSLLL